MPDASTLVRERHSLRIEAPSEVVYRSLWDADFGGPVVNALLGIRALPRVVTQWISQRNQGRHPRHAARGLTLRRFLDAGFVQLDEVPNVELVLGLTGRFWTPTGGLIRTERDSFRAGPKPGYAQAAWNFRLTALDSSRTELSTETRVRVADDARRPFLMYWSVVRPFSGLLRRVMLRDVRRVAVSTPDLPIRS